MNQTRLTDLKPTPLVNWPLHAVSGVADLAATNDRLVRVQAATGDADGLAIIAVGTTLSTSAPAARLLSLRSGSDGAPTAAPISQGALPPPLVAALSLRVNPDARHGLLALGLVQKQLPLLSFRGKRGISTAIEETLRCAHAVSRRARRGDRTYSLDGF